MAIHNSNKNRGMLLEKLINNTIEFYHKNEVGLFHKNGLDIKFSSVSKDGNKLRINNGLIKNKSQVDYYGIYKGYFIAFEVKSTKSDRFTHSNLKPHQKKYLSTIKKYSGISFLIVGFIDHNRFFAIDHELLNKKEKSTTLDYFIKKSFEVELTYPGVVDFVSYINSIL